MNKKVITDYGKTISADTYIRILKEHPYISQSDQKIINLVDSVAKKHESNLLVYDIGCGPGRLTLDIARLNYTQVIGWDLSEDFITYAEASRPRKIHTYEFRLQDCTRPWQEWEGPVVPVDVIVMQGVLHHIHGKERAVLIQNCFELLKQGGTIIIGDEFVRNYSDETDRKISVFCFYLHIINEALKGGFVDLAEEEAKNLVDDVFSDTKYAGLHNKHVFEVIFSLANSLGNEIYQQGQYRMANMKNETLSKILTLQGNLQTLTESIDKSFNRGDYKVSIPVLVKEIETVSNLKRKDEFLFGPVKELGGMAVLTFTKEL